MQVLGIHMEKNKQQSIQVFMLDLNQFDTKYKWVTKQVGSKSLIRLITIQQVGKYRLHSSYKSVNN